MLLVAGTVIVLEVAFVGAESPVERTTKRPHEESWDYTPDKQVIVGNPCVGAIYQDPDGSARVLIWW